MSQVFFDEMEIPLPDYDLGIGSGTHGAQTGRMIEGIERVLLHEKPDWALVYGDTNSTLAGALAASKLHLPLAHVEAGLRSFNKRMPEEINRVLTDHVANLLFAPTRGAVENLKREGLEEPVRLVGDVMYDAALYYGRKAEKVSRILDRLQLERGCYVLATIHRAENTDSPEVLRSVFEGLAGLARDFTIVVPLHPRTRGAVERETSLNHELAQLRVIDPVGYLDMMLLERNARLIVTDSGGVQKEAFFHRVPCVTLRAETEWVELVELGWNRLVPPRSAELVRSGVQAALEAAPGRDGAPYGSGDSSEAIADALLRSR
jgi:UDP-GlcNAc3NAcA epimerase